MSFAFIATLSLIVIAFAAATLVTTIALLRAPVGVETNDGFRFVADEDASVEGATSGHLDNDHGLAA